MEMEMEKHIILEQTNPKKENIGSKIDDFEILQILGRGKYGFVSKVKSKINQKIYAIKVTDFSLIKDELERQVLRNEIEIISNLDSPHIIKFYGYFKEGERFYIIMEYINNGNIKDYIFAYKDKKKPIPEEELWNLFYQCMSGLVYIHNKNIIHRDIEPENLFITENKTIKIGDFNASAMRKIKRINNQNLENLQPLLRETLKIGNPLYMSPEMYNHKGYGSKVDVYSMGCTFYEMCFFEPPRIPIPIISIKGEKITDLQDISPKQNINTYSQELLNIIKEMIEKDENKRLSSNEILEMIRKRFIIHNSSIVCVFRCLFTYKNIIEYLKRCISKCNTNEMKIQKPITFIFLYAFDNYKNYNYNKILNEIRKVLLFNNPFFEEINEIEPENLIDFLIKKLHIENNKKACPFSRIYTIEDDFDFFDEKKILEKYGITFIKYFQSLFSDEFFGTKEIIKKCLNCNKPKYYIESFYYLKFDAFEVNKYFYKTNNFILDVFKKESENYVQSELFCPICMTDTIHKINKKILSISSNLIISLECEIKSFDNQNLKYPLTFNLDNIGFGTYNLKGVVKKNIIGGKIYFICLYKEMNQWFLSNGTKIEKMPCSSPLNHNIGNVVMLFYSNKSE